MELQFLDGADRVLAEGTITPNDSGGFHGSDKAMTASDGSSWSESVSDREEPSLDLHVPAAVRQVAVTLGDREPVRLSLALSTTDRNLVGVVLAEGK